jgi:hypothetical protein
MWRSICTHLRPLSLFQQHEKRLCEHPSTLGPSTPFFDIEFVLLSNHRDPTAEAMGHPHSAHNDVANHAGTVLASMPLSPRRRSMC